MKILVDLTYIHPDSVTGVANYALRLLKGFIKCNVQHFFILLLTSENKALLTSYLPEYKIIIFDTTPVPYIKGYIYKKKLNKIIRKEKVDIFFSPFVNYSGLYQTLIPSVGVLHDAQGFELMKTSFKQMLYNIFTRHMLRKVTYLVTISEYSKQDIQHKLPKYASPIAVIYNSIEVKYTEKRNDNSYTKPYILNVNTLEPYKNLITLIKAFDLIRDIIPHQLVIKASVHPYWYDVVEPYIKQHKLEDRITLISERFTEDQMADLYQNADLFVSPSLKEGFGYTPIEAALYQVPVVCTKESALYETTLGLLNYYEPATDPEALKKTILDVLSNSQPDLKDISQVYTEKYSQERQASNFMHLFKNVFIDRKIS